MMRFCKSILFLFVFYQTIFAKSIAFCKMAWLKTETSRPQNGKKMAHSPPMTRKGKRATLVSYQIGTSGKADFQSNLRAAFLLSKIETEVENMERDTLSNRLRTAYWSLVAVGCGLLLSVRPVLAETIWDRFSSIMQDIYGQVVAISTIVAVTVAAIALIVRMVSRNQRAVDEATSWLKRIVVTWIVLNTLGFIVAYLQPLIAGGQYTGG